MYNMNKIENGAKFMDNLDVMIYAYASIRTGHNKEDLKRNFRTTKVYRDFENMFLYIPDEQKKIDYLFKYSTEFRANDTLQVDIMTGKRDNMRVKLNGIIRTSEKRKVVIVVKAITAFGDSESIKHYYEIFEQKGIGVLIPDYTRDSGLSEYSTCDYSFDFRQDHDLIRAYELIRALEPNDIQDTRGRIGYEYTRAFRVAFWLYELFKVSEDVAVSISGLSKTGFHTKGDNYEQTQNYKKELSKMEEVFQISSLVKRNRAVPKNFNELKQYYEKTGDLESACIYCKIPMIFPIDYERLLLKEQGGRKEIARCMKLYDENLVQAFEDWIKAGKEVKLFYKQCGIEQYLYNTTEIK